MIAIDTNILVYAHRPEFQEHQRALNEVKRLFDSSERWAIPWPVVHEYLSKVTNPRIFAHPTPLPEALRVIETLIDGRKAQLLSETEEYWSKLDALLQTYPVVGPKVHDARIVAICMCHGVRKILSADRDLLLFAAGIEIENPLK